MKLATWNVNSIRIRLHLIKKLAEEEKPDIIFLQETKVIDDLFPQDFLKELGYEYLFFQGEKSYNGVAILSKLPLHSQFYSDMNGKGDCRHIGAMLDNGIELHNFYIPAGGDLPDPELNSKFKYKLQYIQNVRSWFLKNKKITDKIILAGDLNIAPLESDVWSHTQLLKEVSHSPIEIETMLAWQKEFQWCDVSRHFTPAPQKIYSWWSYRNQDWKKSQRGRRLDHIWVTYSMLPILEASSILKEARDWPEPSDHVPVISVFK
jgi:exodeoxyribonuclease-3